MRPVEIYYRDCKSVNGLMVPYVLETTVQAAKQSHNMTIENVAVKPKLEHSLFRCRRLNKHLGRGSSNRNIPTSVGDLLWLKQSRRVRRCKCPNYLRIFQVPSVQKS